MASDDPFAEYLFRFIDEHYPKEHVLASTFTDPAHAKYAAELILRFCGIGPEDNGDYAPPFADTPERFARAIAELTSGHREACPELRTFEYTGSPQLITCLNTQAYTLCPHHLLAVELSCSVGYVVSGSGSKETSPGRILGLSKLPRLITWASRRLTTQEELADLITQKLHTSTGSENIFVHIEGTHSCMRARGIKTNGVVTTYLARSQDPRWEQAFLRELNR